MIMLILLMFVAQLALGFELELRAVKGLSATIPCGPSKVFLDGPDAYVMWINSDNQVLYKYPENEGDYTSVDATYDPMCDTSPDMENCREKTSLYLPNVSIKDAGLYLCRAHFQSAPSIDYFIKLNVVGVPDSLNIYTVEGTRITADYIEINKNTTLICESANVNPDTIMYWERNGERYGQGEIVAPGLMRSTITISTARREDNNITLSCVLRAGDVSPAIRRRIMLKMFLPMTSIKLGYGNKKMTAGKPEIVQCFVTGLVPTPSINWYLDDQKIDTNQHTETMNGDVVISTLRFVVKSKDDNRILSCRATNSFYKKGFAAVTNIKVENIGMQSDQEHQTENSTTQKFVINYEQGRKTVLVHSESRDGLWVPWGIFLIGTLFLVTILVCVFYVFHKKRRLRTAQRNQNYLSPRELGSYIGGSDYRLNVGQLAPRNESEDINITFMAGRNDVVNYYV